MIVKALWAVRAMPWSRLYEPGSVIRRDQVDVLAWVSDRPGWALVVGPDSRPFYVPTVELEVVR